jgi:hypothetical protein
MNLELNMQRIKYWGLDVVQAIEHLPSMCERGHEFIYIYSRKERERDSIAFYIRTKKTERHPELWNYTRRLTVYVKALGKWEKENRGKKIFLKFNLLINLLI